ncbi:UDP-N-acetylglucosamine--dolichyl-phosphate N-acetylglucosaminephosphotransferase [Amphibalanus amphitrite]|uniref:UDP-N-acetylglucosamine--dolichyl-phosphate N-acetylglucosaminephosphotransferase n=1 Tax=Amphibalanus amphitrite TaxID=1232801 RepID=A0A6A4VN20_AMPAM|nr:UDP-N-acetylglucosamine--dolichyl-phosphate N-acetylglucosaminephosphotransferase-like isoform X2 [Amphibalanus amphitrite]XP_043209669.1 UDP-N-acetylglucosamine--dolichyl-phosphate N-acetylglucosaminephosphotransferase-like isoform X2 [Amphibalanus amphitrite]XP_043246282.1 UDP-N-acetylglucosamine--dolichyl-phosphate N-acetylglucosaminephosphotransferase-like isoform X2 [Amphibalanus amphitrite]XP_043246283.1 UDP-N-acetylglucosamine--dolichyl-phosphate N-acetylglucosaminephosphotransferase-l
MDWTIQLLINLMLSFCGFIATIRAVPKMGHLFIKANLCGIDMSKKESKKIPEAMGIVCGCIYLIVVFIFIPVPFGTYIVFNQEGFPHEKFVELLAALLSICCMLLLGFADDVLELKWRHKLLLPTVASLPLLMVYFVTYNGTTIIVPKPLRFLVGYSLNLGPLYYVYMGMLAVFCTNAINILAGVNGLEVGQSVVIAASLLAHNVAELGGPLRDTHLFSLYLLLPFIGVSLALLYHNWYPSAAFVGDTYCYFAGMTFAVIGILGHFSKTMLLFFLPQIANFVYSVPQLFHFVPCPRHRLPRYDRKTDRLHMSTSTFRMSSLRWPGRLALRLGHAVGVVHLTESGGMTTCNNLTIINLLLKLAGPLHERRVTQALLAIQVMCSCLAFVIRYPLASLFYDV